MLRVKILMVRRRSKKCIYSHEIFTYSVQEMPKKGIVSKSCMKRTTRGRARARASELSQQVLDVVEAHGVLCGELLFSSYLQTARKRPLSMSS